MEDSQKLKLLWLGLLAGMVLFVLGSSCIPSAETGAVDLNSLAPVLSLIQNLLHIPVFALLSLFCIRYLACFQMSLKQQVVRTVLIGSGVGIFSEAIQMAVPGRYATLTDLLLNALGMLTGIFIYHRVLKAKTGGER